jgi:hypothetical protein
MKRIVQLSDEQKKVYSQMKQTALAFLNGKAATTATVMTQLMRLHQITCGHFTADDGFTKPPKNNRKKKKTPLLLHEVHGKVVIWAHYRHDIETIVEHIKKEFNTGVDNSVMTYYGDTSVEDRQKAIKEIQNPDSPVRFLVGTPQTGGYGITLTAASTMIYYSNGYDLEKRQQSES